VHGLSPIKGRRNRDIGPNNIGVLAGFTLSIAARATGLDDARVGLLGDPGVGMIRPYLFQQCKIGSDSGATQSNGCIIFDLPNDHYALAPNWAGRRFSPSDGIFTDGAGNQAIPQAPST
jgi:hypothetical protein